MVSCSCGCSGPRQQLVPAADQMCPRVSASPSNSKNVLALRANPETTPRISIVSFLMVCRRCEFNLRLFRTYAVTPHRDPGTDTASSGLITARAARFIKSLVCGKALGRGRRPLILSVNRRRRAGNETHNSDTANNTQLSRHAGSITIPQHKHSQPNRMRSNGA